MFLFDFVGWVWGVVYYLLPVVGYCMGASAWYAWYGIHFRRAMINAPGGDKSIYEIGQILGCLVWPLSVVISIGYVSVCFIQNVLEDIMLTLESRKHTDHVERNKAKMISDDLERFGGNMELIVNYDYVRHDLCFGQGCSQCNEQGVIRRKANRVVEEHEVINDSTNFKLAQKRQEYDREVAMRKAQMQAAYIAETGRNT